MGIPKCEHWWALPVQRKRRECACFANRMHLKGHDVFEESGLQADVAFSLIHRTSPLPGLLLEAARVL